MNAMHHPLCAVLNLRTLQGALKNPLSLAWYHSLSLPLQAEADRLASDLGWKLFGRLLDQLSSAEAQTVVERVKALPPLAQELSWRLFEVSIDRLSLAESQVVVEQTRDRLLSH